MICHLGSNDRVLLRKESENWLESHVVACVSQSFDQQKKDLVPCGEQHQWHLQAHKPPMEDFASTGPEM